VVPVAGIVISLGLMASLPPDTWLRLLAWLAIGMLIYLRYGRKHSRLRNSAASAPST
jgi:APA family basic amino acid/polyamine antiporter